MQRGKKRAAMWPLIATPAVIFTVGFFADFVLSSYVRGLPAESVLPAAGGITFGALTVLTFARRREAYIVAAALFSAIAIIAMTLSIDLTVRIALAAACLFTVAATLCASTIAPEAHPVRVRPDDRTRR